MSCKEKNSQVEIKYL